MACTVRYVCMCVQPATTDHTTIAKTAHTAIISDATSSPLFKRFQGRIQDPRERPLRGPAPAQYFLHCYAI